MKLIHIPMALMSQILIVIKSLIHREVIGIANRNAFPALESLVWSPESDLNLEIEIISKSHSNNESRREDKRGETLSSLVIHF